MSNVLGEFDELRGKLEDKKCERQSLKSNSIFIIMHKDVEVLSYDIKTGEQNVIDKDLVPWDYKDSNFIEWCAGRVLAVSRKNAKYIFNALGVSQDNSDSTRAHLALTYHCVSLNDCYWTKRSMESVGWDSISLFRNKSENILTPVALQGKVSTLFNQRLRNACDITAEGTYRKSWCRIDEGFELLKGDDDVESQEALREVRASRILQVLGFNVITYMIREYEGESVSVSRCFTNEKLEFIPFRSIKRKYGTQATDFITSHFYVEYLKMALATYIIGNVDLHDGNWGVYRNTDNGEMSFAALFDFNNSFTDEYVSGRDVQSMWIPLSKLIDLESGKEISSSEMFEYDCRYVCDETIESMAKFASEQVHVELDIGRIELTDFLDYEQYKECVRRCENINRWAAI